MKPLGGFGLPTGFTELEYLEGSGTQWINTGKSIYGWSSNVGVETRFVIPGSEGHASFKIVVFGCRQASRVKNFEVSGYEAGLLRWGTQHVPYCTLHLTNHGRDLVTDFTLHDKKSTWLLETGEKSTQTLTEDPEWLDIPIYLFALNENGKTGQCSLDKIYFFRLFNGQELVQELVPILDADATPCMYDKISRKCFYNDGTGSFIVGMTMRQLPALLHLPTVTSGELKLSLPWEAQLIKYGAPAILEEVKNKGWTLIVQYAEPDTESAVYNKYAACKTVADMIAVNPDYTRDLTRDGGWIYPLSSLLDALYLFQYTTLQYVQCDAPLCTNAHGAVVYSENLESFSGDWSSATDARWMFAGRKVTKLRDVNTVFPALEQGYAMFRLCILNKESVIRVANSLPSYTSGTHEICFGIHVDHQSDEEVLAALEAAEAKGWTLTVQWNGTATAAAASTYGLRRPPVYAKPAEPREEEEQMLDWGHYVTNWEENGYTEFASLEEAYAHFINLAAINQTFLSSSSA